ncbi:preprotein translocase subunit YajC [Corynebacterium sp. 320]|uniref:Preprotein translocase subunit YajC n=1 Tax=Corynebacterium zhongnanshanii TaxID=2768834 RepID=A0ABQ6VLV0_9CORY|nr:MULTISPECIES: preprotein translocase subunit YajC [Corynebacterium]KAB1503724.1 preprotein translocase subunit YajC [Corynebacterium sp. 320]KAB1553176.1 preprotein translocase subunit YajC [Corynebacterium sp. 321]KAB1553606.1 preprotein translocase subunit YajC [Corynebacterium sp. 319]KAB3523426.1 preprotein translocase subunit YajC [Corynebacterium zhongnanshanii]KAB3527860.1 preprotein translocase subunit YajC [Corynebacterium sp. 250]
MDALLIILIIAVFLGLPLLQIRKQNKRVREIRAFQATLAVGDEVKTSSGIHGVVSAVHEATVELDIAPGVTTTWDKLAILEKVNDPQPEVLEPGTDTENGNPS